MHKLSPKSIKILKTFNLYCCFFVLGLCVAVPGPCLLDLQNLVQTDTQHIAFIYTARSVGYLLGSILGGILLDAIKSKQTVLTICNFVVGSSMLGIPWSRSLGALTGFMVVNGLALGTVDTGGNVVCLTLWGSDSGPFYQALHFTFGLGGLVAPLIAAPFLGDYSDDSFASLAKENATLTGELSNFTHSNRSHLTTSENALPDILYPFSIIGGFSQLVTLMFLATCAASPAEEKASHDEDSADAKTGLGFLFSVVFLNFILLFVETGTEIGYAQMLTTYVVKSPRLGLPPHTGSFMTSAFWAAFTVSRLASVFLAIRVDNFTLILGDLVVSVTGSLVLLFLASHEWAIWVASVLLGVGIASFFPAAVAWLGTYIHVTNKVASVFAVGAAFGEMVIPFTISYFIETVPDVLIYIVPTSCISSSLIVLVLYLILRKREPRNTDNRPERRVASGSIINT